MPRWRGNWKFQHESLIQNGQTGTELIGADDENSAHDRMRRIISQKLFGTDIMSKFVSVSNLRKIAN